MFDPKQLGRLLRQDWTNPADLARELYDIFTNKDSRTTNAPLTIDAPKTPGVTSIGRDRAASGESASSSTADRVTRASRNPTPDLIKTEAQRTNVADDHTIKDSPDLSFPRPSDLDDGGPSPEGQHFMPSAGNWPAAPGNRPNASNRQNRASQVQSGPDFSPVRPEAGGSTTVRRSSTPESDPLSGSINLEGIRPIPPQESPRSFRPTLDDYDPYDFDGSLTRIPLDEGDGSDVMWGQVVSGKGDTYMMNIYTDPDPDTQRTDFVSVKCIGMDDKEIIPPQTWVYPVILNSEGNQWYALVPMWL